MTSIPVNHAKSVMMDFAAKTPGKAFMPGETGGFTDVLKGQTAGNVAGQEAKGTQPDAEVRSRTQTKVTQSAKERMKQSNVSKAQDDTKQEAVEAADVLQEAGTEVVKEIADKLDVSEEDVLQAMEVLGLSLVDVLKPENLTALVMQTMGETDPMAVLTNEELGTALKLLNQVVQDVRQEVQTTLTITPEQLEELLETAEPVDIDRIMEQNLVETEAPAEAEGEKGQQPRILVEDLSEEEDTLTKVETKPSDEDGKETGAVTENFPKEGKETGKDAGDKGTQEGQSLFFQNTGNQAEAIGAVRTQEVFFAQPQTREIMDQILEVMRVQIKPEMTQLEMQLHPASLGSVNVHIASKEGVITAQFTAQNETVKAVLESQMIQLKEAFTEQGVKVEAIEVSVQANGFRQEYEGSKGQENTADGKKKAPRRIHLNSPLFAEEEALSEEDRLAVSMMEANGSTVDYTA